MRNGRYITEYHCHSTVSPDGHNTMTEMALAAADAGIDELCFTDHVEPLPWVKWNDAPLASGSYDWGAMQRQFDEAQRAVGGRIRLRMGAELGESTLASATMDSFLDSAPPLDFTIGSVHAFRVADGTVDDFCWLPGEERAWYDACTHYFNELARLVEWGRFHVVGHLTLPRRYAKELHGIELDLSRYEEQIRAVLRRVVETGHGIELNTNRAHEPLPGEMWLRMYRELGGEIITLGSDAHVPQHLGSAMERGQELLSHCGFRYFTTFAQGKPEFHKL